MPIITKVIVTSIVSLTGLSSHLTCGQTAAGNEACPCLTIEYYSQNSNHTTNSLTQFDKTIKGSSSNNTIDPNKYGIGCFPHDINSLKCSNINDCTTRMPLPLDCEKSYCRRSWCYVNPATCQRVHYPSTIFDNQYYSYATCGELDSFTYTDRLKSLRERIFQVGYASNSGGWKGAYNPSGSFAINQQWNGPTVDFVREAALEGGFGINMTKPPGWLRSNAEEFFGNGQFDLCFYAVALGYLDFCVGAFTITEKRSSITTMFEIASDPIYLIVHRDGSGAGHHDWESFSESALTIFKPFSASAWIMIFLVFLPLLGMLMFFHEYGVPGSAYPRNEQVLVEREEDDGQGHGGGGQRISTMKVIDRPISKITHCITSIYMGTLSCFSGSYDQSVVSVGGKINLLAIASFIMLILAVYTANLAAILTQDANKSSVVSIEMAVKQGLNICAERKVANFIMETFGVHENNLVPDPVELGGDGRPGFNCPKCESRERIFNYMRLTHDDPSQYCNVAIASLEDLDALHHYGKHCDKMKVGDSLDYRSFGIPIHDGDHSDALVSLLHKVKENSVMTRTMAAAVPENQCPETEGEGTALSVRQLTGVWLVTFFFVLLALLAKLVSGRYYNGSRRKCRGLRGYDQWGNPPVGDLVVDRYKYDAETNELQKGGLGIASRNSYHVETNELQRVGLRQSAQQQPQCLNTSELQDVSAVVTEELSLDQGDQQPQCLERSATVMEEEVEEDTGRILGACHETRQTFVWKGSVAGTF